MTNTAERGKKIMHKRGSFLFALLLSCVLLLSLMSCRKSLSERVSKKVSEKIDEGVAKAQGEDIGIDISDEKLTVTNESGEEMAIGMSDFPEGWPKSIWVPTDIEVAFGSAMEAGEETTMWIVSAGYPGRPEDLFDIYKERMSNWEIKSESANTTDQGGTYVLQISSGAV